LGGRQESGRGGSRVSRLLHSPSDIIILQILCSSENQKILLEKALSVVERIPPPVIAGGSADENAWKNCWNWNLTDAAFGQLVLDIKEGRVNAEMRSQGFNYAYRRQSSPTTATNADNAQSISTGPNQGLNNNGPASASFTKPGTPLSISKSGTPAPNATAASPTAARSPGLTSPAEGDAANGQNNMDKEKEKRDKRKQKEKEKKAEKAAERAAAAATASPETNGQQNKRDKRSNGPTKLDTTDGAPGTEDTGALSPGGETGGALTPVSRRGSRNPWTLFVKHLPVPVTEDEIRDFFGDAKSGVSNQQT
jgi:hypothetical protein